MKKTVLILFAILLTGFGQSQAQDNLLTNGDFENGRTAWTETAGEIRTEGENSYFIAEVAQAGNSFDVNLSQILTIEQGKRFILSFDASTGEGATRTMIAGIGLNVEPFTTSTKTVTLTDQTQTFILELTSAAFGGPDSRVLFDMGAEVGVVVIDNVSLVEDLSGGNEPSPSTAAPVPVIAEADVMSLFSAPYTDVTVDTWRTDWSAAGYSEVMIGERTTKKYEALDFVGVETVANQLNVSEMTHFHISIWTANATDFSVKLVDFGSNAAFAGGDDTEHQIDFTGITQNEWLSLNIPLSDFVGLTSKNNIAQIILVAKPSGSATVFVDNVLFHKGTGEVVSVEDQELTPSNFTLEQNYPNPFNPSTKISFSTKNAAQVSLEVYNVMGQKLATLVNGVVNSGNHTVSFDATNYASGMYLYKLTAGNFSSVKSMMLIK